MPRTISDLEHKKAWFEANQAIKTKEEVEKVEKQIAKMQKKSGASNGVSKEANGDAVEDADEEDETEPQGIPGAKEPLHSEYLSRVTTLIIADVLCYMQLLPSLEMPPLISWRNKESSYQPMHLNRAKLLVWMVS